jgi:hypothetical protein
LRFAGFFFESLMVSKSVEVCRFLLSGWPFRVGVDRLECKLRLISLGFHSTFSPSSFGLQRCFLDSDGPFTFDSRSGVRV